MATLENKIIITHAEMRPCMVLGVKALFHKWVEREEFILKMRAFLPHTEIEELKREYERGGYIPRGVDAEKIKTLRALVEYEDGTVEEVAPVSIRFLDSPHDQYDFTEREAKNKNAEFACRVCMEKYKKEYPDAITCAWRGLDNEYCPELKKILEREDAKQ